MADIVDPRIEEYAVAHSTPEPALFADLAAETRTSTSAPSMMVGTLEGRFLSFLVTMLRPQLVLEIGTFTGYSALSMAEALPPGGRIVTCDISEDHVAIARRHIDASPHRDRIEIRVGPAIDTLKSLDGPFDLAFIDADKDRLPRLLRGDRADAGPGRRDRGGQRAVERPGARRRPPTRSTSRRAHCASSTTTSSPTSGSSA